MYHNWKYSFRIGTSPLSVSTYGFHLDLKIRFWVTMLVFQLHSDLASELIKLCEYSYHRDLKNVNHSPSSRRIPTYHSCLGKYPQSVLDLAMADLCPSEYST
jgi:hypothetical protein